MFNVVLEQVPLDKLGLMMGVASLITAMATAVGPSLGGMIVNTFVWCMIFIAGCLLLPGCVLGALLAPVSGRLLDKFGAKRPIITGNIFIILATLCYSIFAKNMTSLFFIIFYIFFAFGQGFSVGNTMTNGLKQLPENLNTDGNAIFNTLQQLSGAIGTSIITTIVSTAQAKMPNNLAFSTMLGSQSAFLLLCVLAFIAFICSLCVFHHMQNEK